MQPPFPSDPSTRHTTRRRAAPDSRRRVSARAMLAFGLMLVAAGCSSGAASPGADAGAGGSPASMAPASHGASMEPSMPPESAEPESMAPESMAAESAVPESVAPEPTPGNAAADALAARPWATATLTDVTTGEPFRIADLAGRTVFVESMAIWCTNCRAQQARFADALDRLDPDRVAYVVLTVDPGESADDLRRYKKDRGFTGMYAVAGTAVSKALRDDFGANALNPPSVPLVLVTPDGRISFSTGGESAEEIVTLAGG
jgi:thiol-disulfide isomerase/thioredoxin